MSTGTMDRPDRKISAQKGVHCHTSVMQMAANAPVGLPSQSKGWEPNRPMAALATPKSRLKISRPRSPTTA